MIADTWGRVCSFLDLESLAALGGVNRLLRDVARDHPHMDTAVVLVRRDVTDYARAWPNLLFVPTHEGVGLELALCISRCLPDLPNPVARPAMCLGWDVCWQAVRLQMEAGANVRDHWDEHEQMCRDADLFWDTQPGDDEVRDFWWLEMAREVTEEVERSGRSLHMLQMTEQDLNVLVNLLCQCLGVGQS